ncbi:MULTISPECIES: ParB/RepB/Spo0J family partition protein [Hafniaceae]|uniref:ParB/RepB/Spo0J family partition protein n=1 Tax=Hafniaceae TaxID=1903412 RepID=UPI00061D0FF4|nr:MULTISPECIES: ParB/RepB/Spo0J family partition protein [Hafniaceae]KKF38514.1 hypothetical protein PU01_22915 [Hafnia alvei]MBW3478355.1 ParB/RepB/Spo0J family partition protein [Hafnia alvei]MCE9871070.1 ParB/RepB/Spo0J family partition protein [Hafnia alvei]MDX6842983.1 ParB/RepB/Spo0J family partition protein [Hafnia paralvei]PNK70587.1 hypothetical protein A6J69_000295 [Hafnia paralvei]
MTVTNTVKNLDAEVLNNILKTTQVSYVSLSTLVISPLNVRSCTYSQKSISELAKSILSVGLLQNLVVHSLSDGTLGVAAGGRRLTAMNQLVGSGEYIGNELIPVKVIDEKLALAASMSENGHRSDMHPYEQIIGFKKMSLGGDTAAQIGDLMGYGARHVQKCLRLADMAPALLESLAKDDITLDQLQALSASEDHQRQLDVWQNSQSAYSYEKQPEYLRRAVLSGEISAENNPQLRLVGRECYEQSGGTFRYDLFANEGFITEPTLLERLAREKLHATAKAIANAEGWKWSEGRLSAVSNYVNEDRQLYRIAVQPDAELTEEEKAKISVWEAERDALDDTDDFDRIMELNEKIELIEDGADIRAWTDSDRSRGGVVASIKDGILYIQRGVMLRSEDENATQAAGQVNDSIIKNEELVREPIEAISLPLLTKMTSERTLAVQAALMQQNDKAVALLAWTLCITVFSSGAYNKAAKISIDCRHYSLTDDAPSGAEGVAYTALMQEKSRLKALLPHGWAHDFNSFFALSKSDLMALLGFCVSCSIDGVQTRDMGHTSRSPLDALEIALGFNMRDWWQPTRDNFFGHMKKTQIIDALNDAGETAAARNIEKMKKSEAAGVAELSMNNNQWVPNWLRSPETQSQELDMEETSHNIASAA